MPPLDVDGVLLSFEPGWQVQKFDEAAWYRDGDAIGSRIKAVDVTAFGPSGHWWIEVKNCHGHEPDNLPRLNPGVPKPQELQATEVWIAAQGWERVVEARRRKPYIVDEVVQKVAGTIATLVAAERAPGTEARAAQVQPNAKAYAPGTPLNVVLLLTWSLPDFGRLARGLKHHMEQRLSAFNVTCYVVNEAVTVPTLPWTAARAAP